VINNGRRIPLAIQRSLHVAEVKHYRAGRKPLILRGKQPTTLTRNTTELLGDVMN
jgi:hypothetical protein